MEATENFASSKSTEADIHAFNSWGMIESPVGQHGPCAILSGLLLAPQSPQCQQNFISDLCS